MAFSLAHAKAPPLLGIEPRVMQDVRADAVARPTDAGPVLIYDTTEHRLPDLVTIALGAWTADDPAADVFAGFWHSSGEFVRIELHLADLVNPPGPVGPGSFDPFRYGDHPVYGFVEIDMDGDVNTGGELDAPGYRYLANAVRFGGRVLRPDLKGRAAEDPIAPLDGDFLTPPFIERHGEEFHLALTGAEFVESGVAVAAGDSDSIFEPGETWNILGRFFHRAHGFEPFSFAKGGQAAGEYAPLCDLQFSHEPAAAITRVSLVFPLTNVGAGLRRGEQPQPMNQSPSDHASILEAFEDLHFSALLLSKLPTGLPEEVLIADWANRVPADHLDPRDWAVTVLLGSSYIEPPSGLYFVWSDVYPDVALGDVDGSGAFDGRDRQAIAQHIAQRDASDGEIDGAVQVANFALGFSLYDVNHDGVVNGLDLSPIAPNADADSDGDVDLNDFAVLQRCFLHPAGSGECSGIDLNGDFAIDLDDLGLFFEGFGGPFGD